MIFFLSGNRAPFYSQNSDSDFLKYVQNKTSRIFLEKKIQRKQFSAKLAWKIEKKLQSSIPQKRKKHKNLQFE